MKVLDEGPSDFYYEFTCKGCKAKLAAEADDVTTGYFGANYGGDRPTKGYYVTCPRCGTDFKLETDKIPLLVRQRADENASEGDWQ